MHDLDFPYLFFKVIYLSIIYTTNLLRVAEIPSEFMQRQGTQSLWENQPRHGNVPQVDAGQIS